MTNESIMQQIRFVTDIKRAHQITIARLQEEETNAQNALINARAIDGILDLQLEYLNAALEEPQL